MLKLEPERIQYLTHRNLIRSQYAEIPCLYYNLVICSLTWPPAYERSASLFSTKYCDLRHDFPLTLPAVALVDDRCEGLLERRFAAYGQVPRARLM
jgi:hypothetical protein